MLFGESEWRMALKHAPRQWRCIFSGVVFRHKWQPPPQKPW
jgi:hypothetical protein